VERILRSVRTASVLVAIIGPTWLAAEQGGRRRIDDDADWVRREIAEAFAAQIPVVPILVDDAPRLSASDLPAEIEQLGRCQYLRLHHRNVQYDIKRLVDELTSLAPELAPLVRPVPIPPRPIPTARSRPRAVVLWLVLLICLPLVARGDSRQAIPLVVAGNPMLIQAAYGPRKDFILASALAEGGLVICSRQGSNFDTPWRGPTISTLDRYPLEAGSLIWSTFGAPEMVYRSGDRLLFTVRDAALHWVGPFPIAVYRGSDLPPREVAGVSGTPGFIQVATPGKEVGDFVVVTPLAGGGLAFYRRDNVRISFRWSGPERFEQRLGKIDAVTVAEGAQPGSIEVVARASGRLFHGIYGSDRQLSKLKPIVTEQGSITNAGADPSLIRGGLGRARNLELIVPLSGGGIAHYWRDEDSVDRPWHWAATFGEHVQVRGAALVFNEASPGKFEAVARIGQKLVRFWRDNSGTWHGPGSSACGAERINRR
jgi:hypothetical protein